MKGFFQKHHGMTIVGQGGKIMLVTFPSLLAAVLVHRLWPRIAALPGSFGLVRPVGYLLLALGLALWGTAVIQLLTVFARGRLVTTGAYALTYFVVHGIFTVEQWDRLFYFPVDIRNLLFKSGIFIVISTMVCLTLPGISFLLGSRRAHREDEMRRQYDAI